MSDYDFFKQWTHDYYKQRKL